MCWHFWIDICIRRRYNSYTKLCHMCFDRIYVHIYFIYHFLHFVLFYLTYISQDWKVMLFYKTYVVFCNSSSVVTMVIYVFKWRSICFMHIRMVCEKIRTQSVLLWHVFWVDKRALPVPFLLSPEFSLSSFLPWWLLWFVSCPLYLCRPFFTPLLCNVTKYSGVSSFTVMCLS